jgi:sugar phosphate isomerase/epimerase
MNSIKGPAIFLAQFMSNQAPFNNLENACRQMTEYGYKGVQIPTWDTRCVDLPLLAQSKDYAEEIKGKVEACGLKITELSTHLQGQLVAVHPAYHTLFNAFAPQKLHKDPKAKTEWAINQLKYAAQASKNLGIDRHVTFSGALLWPTVYPWPQRPAGLVEAGFQELANRWTPVLNYFDELGIDLCYELHPGEDLHDGITFERFLEATGNHMRANILYDPSHFVLQCLDYLAFIDIYHERIKMFHVKDAEYRPNGRSGVYGGYQDWVNRPGRFRSLGDGQTDFKQIFSKLTQYNFSGWAVVEWECALKHPEDGAREGAKFVADQLIRVTERAFDDFAGSAANHELNKQILGI